jgi:hypothetical protein
MVTGGTIIIRQLGTLIHPGDNVGHGARLHPVRQGTGVVKISRWGKVRKKGPSPPSNRSSRTRPKRIRFFRTKKQTTPRCFFYARSI